MASQHPRPRDHDTQVLDNSNSVQPTRYTNPVTLPSTQLCALFEKLALPLDSSPAPLAVVKTYLTEVIPRLRAVLPHVEIPPNGGLVTIAQCSFVHLRLLIYAVTNNLAGLDDPEEREFTNRFILQYLGVLATDLFRAHQDTHMRQALFRDFPSMRPLTETLFTAAVEVGDVRVADHILAWPECGLVLNEVAICEAYPGTHLTVLEFAAYRLDVPLVRFLVSRGADVNAFHIRSSRSWLSKPDRLAFNGCPYSLRETSARGSLECALCSDEVLEHRHELVEYLVERGAHFQPFEWGEPCELLFRRMIKPGHESTVDLLMGRFITSENQSTWMECGFFHIAFEVLEQRFLHHLLDSMCGWQCDFSHYRLQSSPPFGLYSENSDSGHSKFRIPFGLQRPFVDDRVLAYILDICAARGHSELFYRLLDLGAQPSSETMIVALAAKQIEIASYLKSRVDGDIYQFSPLLRTLPLAESILLQNNDFIPPFPLFTDNNFYGPGYQAVLRAAATIGDRTMVRSLLDTQGLTQRLAENRPKVLGVALAEACYRRDTEMVTLLLEAGASPKEYLCIDPDGLDSYPCLRELGCLALATLAQDARSVDALIEHGAATDEQCDWGSAAYYAARSGNLTLVRTLEAVGALNGDADVVAAQHGHWHIVKELLATGAAVACNKLLYEAIDAQKLDMVEVMLSSDASIIDCRTLRRAISIGNDAVIQTLGQHLVKVFPRLEQFHRVDILQALISHEGFELLSQLLSFQGGRSDSYMVLSQKPAWFHRRLLSGIYLKGKGVQRMLKLLLGAGIDANAWLYGQSSFGSEDPPGRYDARFSRDVPPTTLLLEAIKVHRRELIELLIEYHVDINLPAKRGIRRTPIQQAAESGFHDIVKMLLMHGADANAAPAVRNGATALQLAAIKGYIGIAELLIAYGADVCAAAAAVNGRTAIEGAAEWGRFDMVRYLVSHANIPEDQLVAAKNRAQENGHRAIVDAVTSMLLGRRMWRVPLLQDACFLPESREDARITPEPATDVSRDFFVGTPVDHTIPASRATTSSLDLSASQGYLRSQSSCALWSEHGIAHDLQSPQDQQSAAHVNEPVISVDSMANAFNELQVPSVQQINCSAGLAAEDREPVAPNLQPVCHHCHMRFCKASSLRRHVRTKHTTTTSRHMHRCRHCDRGFFRKDLCDRHQAKHDKSTAMYASCPECKRRHRKDYLKKHVPECQARAVARANRQRTIASMISTFQLSTESDPMQLSETGQLR